MKINECAKEVFIYSEISFITYVLQIPDDLKASVQF